MTHRTKIKRHYLIPLGDTRNLQERAPDEENTSLLQSWNSIVYKTYIDFAILIAFGFISSTSMKGLP